MQWDRVAEDRKESGKYTILRSKRYLLFYGRTAGNKYAKPLGGFDTAKEAMVAAEKHYAEQL